jgi:type VI protein secretion system component VasF
MENINLSPPLDLMELRRQLVAVRSQHSHDKRIVQAINSLIRKLAHLHKPENRRHEDALRRTIMKTVQRVDEILSARSTDARNPDDVVRPPVRPPSTR